MILGIGSDLCSIERITTALTRHGDRFATRIFSPDEIALANSRPANRAACLAKRFAAKEACAKAMRTGFGRGFVMADIAVTLDPLGAPSLLLSGGAAQRLAAMTPAGHEALVHVSLTDDHPWAQAFVIIEARQRADHP